MDVFSLTYLTYALLMAASTSVESGEARRFTFEALAAADESSQGFLKIITRVALALLDPTRTNELLSEADRLARVAQSSKLVDAIFALRSGRNDLGMLTHFVGRFRKDQHHTNLPTLNVSLVKRSVSHGDTEIALSKRELELVLFLAHQRQSISAQTIADAMWSGKINTLDTLYVTIRRLRSRLPIDAVERQGEGYRLTRNVVVDLVAMEEYCRATQGPLPLSDLHRSELTEICERLSASPSLVPWEWFEATQARIDRLRNQVVIVLAKDAFERKAYHDAISLAHTQLMRDECDETACDIAIRAALAHGDLLTARNILHTYERNVKREIGTAAPTYLRDIVNGATHNDQSATTSARLPQSALKASRIA